MEIKATLSGVCIDDFMAAGVREGKYGVALLMNPAPCRVAGVFTKNHVKASPILLTMERVAGGVMQAVIANSGNANACVKEGDSDASRMAEIAGSVLGIDPSLVGVASTGIIGRRIDLSKIESLSKDAAGRISSSPDSSLDAAKAIMTTDTRVKQLSFEYKGIEIGGVCKGSGMIAPDMATMLCFLTTNADLPEDELRDCLKKSVDKSFNMLVIDDMSTNDMVLLLSDGRRVCGKDDFQYLLDHVTREFARIMAFDAEGATKLVEVEVRGAVSDTEARDSVRAITSSYLVKAAMYGENPNWGRIIAAIGTVIEVDFEKVDLYFESGVKKACLVETGVLQGLDEAAEILKEREVKVVVDLNSGDGKAVGWGSDLSYGYVKINAEYN